MRIDQNGFVGIGTTSPGANLEVVGSLKANFATFTNSVVNWSNTALYSTGGGLPSPNLTLENGSPINGSNATLKLAATNASSSSQGAFITAISTSGGGSSPIFAFGSATTAQPYTERMRIDADGRVGIGTPSPSNALDVNGSLGILGTNDLRLGNMAFAYNAGSTFRMNYSSAPTSLEIYSAGISNVLAIGVASNSGKVGIGTATPTEQLHVNGNLKVQGQIYTAVAAYPGATADFSAGNTIILNSAGGSTISLQNMIDGGVYTVIVEDLTDRTYSFSGCTSTFFRPNNGATAARRAVYSIRKAGSNCYVDWGTYL